MLALVEGSSSTPLMALLDAATRYVELLALLDGDGLYQRDDAVPAWRVRERLKTVAVGIVLCLNLGVDPPDAVKPAGTTIHMAGVEIGIADPALSSQKALEVIAKALQVRRPPRSPPPGTDTSSRALRRGRRSTSAGSLAPATSCASTRRSMTSRRCAALSAPACMDSPYAPPLSATTRPRHRRASLCAGATAARTSGCCCTSTATACRGRRSTARSGSSTATSPSTFRSRSTTCSAGAPASHARCRRRGRPPPLHPHAAPGRVGTPCILVLDCSNAGRIIDALHKMLGSGAGGDGRPVMGEDVIILAACESQQQLPSNPALPADLFSFCLTAPLRMALRHSCRNALVHASDELIDSLPGQG